MKCAITLMEPIIILLGKNNMSVSDLLIYISDSNHIIFRCIHKNQIKPMWKTDKIMLEILKRFDVYTKLLVSDNKILNRAGYAYDPAFFFDGVPDNITVCLFSPRNPLAANFRIKI